jgi:hypothetical protein
MLPGCSPIYMLAARDLDNLVAAIDGVLQLREAA